MKQQAFEYPIAARFGRSDFLVSASNRAALEWIERWPNWGARALVLYGPRGSGKTHLAHLWCAHSRALIIPGTGVGDPPPAGITAIAIDDADCAAEEPLLHFYNSAVERDVALLLTMRAPPAALPVALPDLASRLRALPVAGIAPPDDELLSGVLIKHFADRGLHVAPAVIRYLVRRIERSFAAASAIAARLDQAALSARSPVTVRLARELLTGYSEPPSDLTVT